MGEIWEGRKPEILRYLFAVEAILGNRNWYQLTVGLWPKTMDRSNNVLRLSNEIVFDSEW